MTHVPEDFKNIPTQKMGQSAVFSSERARQRKKLTSVASTINYIPSKSAPFFPGVPLALRRHSVTKQNIKWGEAHKADVVVLRTSDALKNTGSDYTTYKKFRALNQAKSTQIRVPTGRTDIAGHRPRLIGSAGWKSRTEDQGYPPNQPAENDGDS